MKAIIAFANVEQRVVASAAVARDAMDVFRDQLSICWQFLNPRSRSVVRARPRARLLRVAGTFICHLGDWGTFDLDWVR